MFITSTDFNTHLYAEIMAEITRDDDTIIDKAIEYAEAEAKAYLSRYDVATLFGGTLPNTTTGHLKNLIKDIAAWQLVKLANPNIDLKLFRTGYEDAIAFLTKIQKGQADPAGWPYPADDPLTDADEGTANNSIQWTSNPKKSQHF